jgi:peptide/nickel transport system substrate-binding protein
MAHLTRRDFALGASLLATTGGIARSRDLAEDVQPRRGGTLTATVGFLEPQAMFVPAFGGGSPHFTATKVIERLVRMEEDQSFRPTLAESWEATPDHHGYTLTLRKGVTWHDGKDFSADDVAFSIATYWKTLKPGGILKVLDGVDIVDRHKVVVRFAKPVPEYSFLNTLNRGFIIPRHVYEQGNIAINPANNAPIGTGPYKFVRWVRGSHAEFVANRNYWVPGQPYIDRLIVRWWREPSARAAALEAGELDIAVGNPISLGDLKRLQQNPNITVAWTGYVGVAPIGIHFNVRNPVVRDRAVRQAILHAIDRSFIADTIYFGYAKPAISPISRNSIFSTADVPRYDFDPAKAARLLDEAGYPVKADGKRFKVKLVATGWSEENPKGGVYLKQVFDDLGIDTRLVVPDRPNSLKALYTDYDFDIAYSDGGSTSMEPVPGLTYLFTTDGIAKGVPFRNASGYSNPQVDALVDQLTFEIDPEKRKALIQDFARLAATEVPVFPLIELSSYTAARKEVQNHSKGANYDGDAWPDIWLMR